MINNWLINRAGGLSGASNVVFHGEAEVIVDLGGVLEHLGEAVAVTDYDLEIGVDSLVPREAGNGVFLDVELVLQGHESIKQILPSPEKFSRLVI